MLPADRPDHEVGWPRAVQTGIAILGSVAFGAIALSYGYGFGGGGRSESYPQSTTAEAPPAGPESSFNFTIYDMDYASLSGDTLVIQGFPMPQGAIDTAYVTDSVEIRVEGTEVGAYVEHRGLAYSDGSARVLFTQFRANPATETSGVLCYSGCTVDSTRITEQSWTTGDTTFAAINSGDSTGINVTTIGYHPVMAFATDSAWLADAYPFSPMATIEEVQALTGNVGVAVDTVLMRFQDYSDMFWDSTQSARINDTPDGAARTDISILNDISGIAGMVGCATWGDFTNSSDNWLRVRFIGGNSQNTPCINANYYDWSKSAIQFGMMRSADSTGVEFMRRAFSRLWWDPMYYTSRAGAGNFCYASEINRRPVAMGLALTYGFTGDSVYVDQLECITDRYGGAAWLPSMGDANGWYEGRIIGFAMDMITASYVMGINPTQWSAKLDTIVTQATNARDDGSPVAYSGGIWSGDSATMVSPNENCTGTWNANARPTNSLMHPIIVQALLRAYYVAEKDTFTVSGSADSTIVSAVVTAVADTFGMDAGIWMDSTSSYANWFGGFEETPGQDCSDPSLWSTDTHDIGGIHAITQYGEYVFDTASAVGADADSTLQRLITGEIITTDFTGGKGWQSSGVREYIFAEYFYTMWEALGWRNSAAGN